MATTIDTAKIARENWQRYIYARERGHETYVATARRLDDMYIGGGRQWLAADRAAVEQSGRKCVELNVIFPAVNTATGEQLRSRVDFGFRPRNEETTAETAEVLSKVARYICDDIKYQWMETQIYSDGLIQQRGYVELYIDFSDNALGEIKGVTLDPMDVIPDPDANQYDPKFWSDVLQLKWMTLDDIRQMYGDAAAAEVENRGETSSDANEIEERSSFADDAQSSYYYGMKWVDGAIVRYVVISRQHRRHEMQKVMVSTTGQVELLDRYTAAEVADMVAQGYMITRRVTPRIRWTVSCGDVLLHDQWSPYRTYTIIPYFPYFRRGITVGMVDNAVAPQELLNKSVSQALHIINTTANSGWQMEENQIVNMREEDLETQGAKTGLVIVRKKGTPPLTKIESNDLPRGLEEFIAKAEWFVKVSTGMNDAVQGIQGLAVSGVAKQADQYQGKTQLAGPLDNLALTRHMVGRKLLELMQDFITEQRVYMIANQSDPTQTKYDRIVVNEQSPDMDGVVQNHIAVGEFDVVVSDQPAAATFEEAQFNQAMLMREKGIGIPDSFIVETSTLSKKDDIIKAMAGAGSDPLNDAKAEEIKARTKLILIDAVGKAVEAQYSAMQAANVIAITPQTAPIADALLLSAGFEDRDQPPIVPALSGLEGMPTGPPDGLLPVSVPTNTNPLTPANPGVGLNAGIETPENEAIIGG